MRINFLTLAPHTLTVLSVFQLCLSHPYLGRRFHLNEILSKRTPYAVVPVDGGSSSSNDSDSPSISPEAQSFSTIAVGATQSTIETQVVTLPPTTDHVTSTKFIEPPTITQVVEVTVTPVANLITITRTSYATVDVSSPSQQRSKSTRRPGTATIEPTDISTLPTSSASPETSSATSEIISQSTLPSSSINRGTPGVTSAALTGAPMSASSTSTEKSSATTSEVTITYVSPGLATGPVTDSPTRSSAVEHTSMPGTSASFQLNSTQPAPTGLQIVDTLQNGSNQHTNTSSLYLLQSHQIKFH